MKEVRKVHYVKGVFVCPSCRQSYVQEKWIEAGACVAIAASIAAPSRMCPLKSGWKRKRFVGDPVPISCRA